MADGSLIGEIEGALASGSPGKQAEMLRRVTDLFLAGAGSYGEEQNDVFDGVISRLAEMIESKARAELAHRLAPVANALLNTVRTLARDESIEVAGPILSQSPRLTDDDLLALAACDSQERLLAISKRATISQRERQRRTGDARQQRRHAFGHAKRRRPPLRLELRHAGGQIHRRRGAGDLRRHAQRHSARAFPHADLESLRGGAGEGHGRQPRRRGRSCARS
jgi:hypothetical protein